MEVEQIERSAAGGALADVALRRSTQALLLGTVSCRRDRCPLESQGSQLRYSLCNR